MNVLLHDMVTGKPFPVHPVADHPFHIAPALLPVPVPEHSLIPIYIASGDFTDIAFLNLPESLHVRTLVVALGSADNAEALGLSLLCGSHHCPVALCIDSYRFLEE